MAGCAVRAPQVIAVIACVALAGGCQRRKQGIEVDERAPPAPADAAAAAAPFPRLFADRITALRIERAGQAPVQLSRDGDRWMVTEPERAAADPRALQFALRELERMEWDPAPAATDPAAWPDLAVTAEQVVSLRVTHGGQALPPLHVGIRRHARIGDSPQVWKLHHLDHYTFARELRLWKDRTVMRLDPVDVSGIELVDARGRKRPADARALSMVQDLEAHAPAGIAAADAGLAPPRATLVVRRKTGPPLELGFGHRESDTTYVRVAGDDRIWKLDNSIADLLSLR